VLHPLPVFTRSKALMRQSDNTVERRKQRLYGRSEEIARLREIYRQTIREVSSSLSDKTECSAARTSPQLVLVSGSSSGVGKRALIDEALHSLAQQANTGSLLITTRFRKDGACDCFASQRSPLPQQNVLALSTLSRAMDDGIINERVDSATQSSLRSALRENFSASGLDRELFPKLSRQCEMQQLPEADSKATMEASLNGVSVVSGATKSAVTQQRKVKHLIQPQICGSHSMLVSPH
jgi:predicted ATPase